MLLQIVFLSLSAFSQDLSICENMGREQCLWALACSKDPKNPNKRIPTDCAQYYKEPEPPPKAEPTAEKALPKKVKSALETLYYVDATEEEKEKILEERSRRQAERVVSEESKVPEKEKTPESQKSDLP
jgi:hypothetical protein